MKAQCEMEMGPMKIRPRTFSSCTLSTRLEDAPFELEEHYSHDLQIRRPAQGPQPWSLSFSHAVLSVPGRLAVRLYFVLCVSAIVIGSKLWHLERRGTHCCRLRSQRLSTKLLGAFVVTFSSLGFAIFNIIIVFLDALPLLAAICICVRR